MPTQLPAEEVLLEKAIVEAIAEIIESIGVVAPGYPDPIPAPFMPKVHTRERFIESDEEDEDETTTPDPVSDDLRRTNVIEIGDPVVSEDEYSGPGCSKLTFIYPIRYECEVVDSWDNNGPSPLRFTNSTELIKAVYTRARRKFKQKRGLGYENCYHYFLQKDLSVTITDEETGGSFHSQEWSLTVEVTHTLV